MGLKNNATKIELLNGVLEELKHLGPKRTEYLNDTYDLTDSKKLSPSYLEETINNYLELSNDPNNDTKTNQMKNLDNLMEGQIKALDTIYTKLELSPPKYTPVDNISEETPINKTTTPNETPIIYIPDELLITDNPTEIPTILTPEDTPIIYTPTDDTPKKVSGTTKGIAIGAAVIVLASTGIASKIYDTPLDTQNNIDNIKNKLFENYSDKPIFDNIIWQYFWDLYNPSEDPKEINIPTTPTTIPTTEITKAILDTTETTSYISIYNQTTNTTTNLLISDFIKYLNDEAPFTEGLNKERIMNADLINDDSIYKIILNGEHIIDDLDETQLEKLNKMLSKEVKGVLGVTEGHNINIYTNDDNIFLTPENYNIRTLNLDKIYTEQNLSELFTIYQIGRGGTSNIELTTTNTDGLNNYIQYFAEHKTNQKVLIDDNMYPDNRHHVLFTDADEGIIEQNAGFYDLIGIINPNLTEEEKIDAIILMDEILGDLATSNGDGDAKETTDNGGVTGDPGTDGPGGD